LSEVQERDQPGAEGDQDRALARRDLMRGLAMLPEEQRAVLLLVGVEDFSYEEAARILELPIGTVMSRLSRGRERLRRYINGDHVPVRRRGGGGPAVSPARPPVIGARGRPVLPEPAPA
jgi:RNA polymerase sigma-70 factor (ECF subfamily)